MVKPAQVQFLHIPVLSRESVLGCSQLNRQKLRVGSCTEEVRKWFNCPVQGTISNAKLASRRYRINLHHRFARACRGQSDSGESCIVLIASCLSCCCSTWTSGEEHWEWGDGQVCANLWCPMSWHPKRTRTIAASRSADLPSEFTMMDGYMENLEKPQNCQDWGVGTCAGMVACPGQYSSYIVFL